MALYNALRLLQPKRPRQLLGVFAVGLAAVGLRSFSGANFRSGLQITHSTLRTSGIVRQLNLRGFFSARSALFASVTSTFTSNMSLHPPQPPPNWTHTPEDVARLTKEAIANHRAVEDKIGALPASECNFESVSRTRRFKEKSILNCFA